MRKFKDIEPYNDKGQRHGLWEVYYPSGNVWYKCSFHNNKVGYSEYYKCLKYRLCNKTYSI